jgi:hypothetical protein
MPAARMTMFNILDSDELEKVFSGIRTDNAQNLDG